MKKIVLFFVVIAIVPWLAKLAGEFGFYLLFGLALLAVVFVLLRPKRDSHTNSYAPDVTGQSQFRRTANAMKAVRRGKMTLAEASQHYGVTEKQIKRLHYFDYLMTHD